MRLKLQLKAVGGNLTMPVNYQYQFSSAIYQLLRLGSIEFSHFLHNQGYQLNGKKFKFFVFAVAFDEMKVAGNLITLLKPDLYLHISSPFIDSFMKNFVVGTFEKQEILLHYQNRTTTLHIAQAEYVPEPHYAETMRFRLLSPLTLSTMVQKDGNLVPYYYRYTDKELVSALKKNLCAKYQLFHKNEPPQAEFEFEFDRREIDRKNGRVSKLITIAEGTERESKVKAIQCGFRLKTNPGLMHIGYECGFGEKNSMGFGMSEVIR